MYTQTRRTLSRTYVCLSAGALLFAGLLAGCSGATSGTGALTREEFLKQGNAICAAGNARINAAVAVASPGQAPTGAAAQKLYDTLLVTVQDQINSLKALTPPDDMKADVGTLLTDAQATLEEIKTQGPDAFFVAQEDQFKDVNAQAGKLGLKECASSE